MNQVTGSFLVGKGLADLPGHPQAARRRRHVEVDHAAAVVPQDEQAVQQAKRRRGNDKQVHRRQPAEGTGRSERSCGSALATGQRSSLGTQALLQWRGAASLVEAPNSSPQSCPWRRIEPRPDTPLAWHALTLIALTLSQHRNLERPEYVPGGSVVLARTLAPPLGPARRRRG